jgi:hypothetical protein
MVEDEDVTDDDTCPECGEPIGRRHVPWYFKLMLAGTGVYVVWRAYQGISWVVHHA